MLSSDISLDLGCSKIRIYMKNKGLVINEPAIIALDTNTKSVVAIGDDAYNMLGRTGENIEFKYPFSAGIITDLSMAEYMISIYIRKIGMGKVLLPNVNVIVPTNITQVQKNAISDVFEKCGIRKVQFVDSALATLKGTDIDDKSNIGVMILNVGYSKTNCSVIASGKVVSSQTINVGGRDFNNTIIEYMRRKYDIGIGPITAEEAKLTIGGVSPRELTTYMHIKGKNLVTGLPQDKLINSDDTVEAFSRIMTQITDLMQRTIEALPEELLGDISKNRIIICGGGAKIYGFERYIKRKTMLNVNVCEDAENAVIMGCVKN